MQQQLHKHIDDICALLSESANEDGYHAVVTRTSAWRKSLLDAAVSGLLKAYNPSTQMLYVYNPESYRTAPHFRLSELNSWLEEGKANLSFDKNWRLKTKAGRTKQRQQEEAILRTFQDLGLNPLTYRQGGGVARGDRSALWSVLQTRTDLFENIKVLDKAIKRLKDFGQIILDTTS